jgi:hypothetical protein
MGHLAEVGWGGGGRDSSVRSGGGVGVGVADQQAGRESVVSRAAWASVDQRQSS